MKKTTAEWLRKAEADRVFARPSRKSPVPLYDGLCFHAQQSAEKNLKGLLEELGLAVPKTHDLVRLLTLLLPHHPSLRSIRRGAFYLTNFAVAVRYPGNNAKKRQAEAARRWAEKIRTAARALLGLPSDRIRRKKK
jgi:HEPN domain-containing protein